MQEELIGLSAPDLWSIPAVDKTRAHAGVASSTRTAGDMVRRGDGYDVCNRTVL